ncbi:UDP-N-acetylmuramoyl-L-alanyl-D-glutamate--2,6-diaminopimelate ligase [Patescibacteria group bacterium]|nr:UDP-N-acetylmuramoyl-L-alanyl-D-glutamate--2,6-diaminopimelate ligase [Patescibacteria group bacterium]
MIALLRRLVPRSWFPTYHFILARLAAFVYRYPSEELIVIGVTGTNGKTTTSYLIAKALESAGVKTGCTSTAILKIGDKEWINPTKMTMPGRFFLQKMLRQMVKAGCKYVVIETSSQGLIQSRHEGISYDMAVFTNLTPEHIEAHGGFEAYKLAKKTLFTHVARRHAKHVQGKEVPRTFVLNADSEHASFYTEAPTKDVHIAWYSRIGTKGLHPDECHLTDKGTDLVVDENYGHLRLPGTYNVENALAALVVAKEFGVSVGDALQNICAVSYVPGRFEEVDLGQAFRVVIDYAPEPESLRQLYGALRLSPRRRLIHVLGSCGGGRDIARRPILGEMAAKEADLVIVTNEDPYDDDPRQIMNDVAAGAESAGKILGKNLWIVEDRKEAIKQAVMMAGSEDVVLLTGKGAELRICVANGEKLPWNERSAAEEAIRARQVSV